MLLHLRRGADRGALDGGLRLRLAVGQAGEIPAAALAGEEIIHILGGRVRRGVQDAVVRALGGDVAHRDVELAALFEELCHGGAVAAHAARDRDLVALGGLVELDGHVVHLKALVGHLEAGAHQLCQIGVHIHRGDQQLLGVRVGVVVVKIALGLLDIIHTAPDSSLPQGQVVDIFNAVKGERVKQDKALQLIFIFLFLGRIVKQLCHGTHAGAQHRHRADQHQYRHQQPKGLPGTAAVQPGVLFRGHIIFHRVSSPRM